MKKFILKHYRWFYMVASFIGLVFMLELDPHPLIGLALLLLFFANILYQVVKLEEEKWLNDIF